MPMTFRRSRTVLPQGCANVGKWASALMMESGSMHIVCPHCTTSYAIKLETLGEAGRTGRCSRCKEVWLARPDDAIAAVAAEPVMAEASRLPERREADLAAQWNKVEAD